MLLQLGALALCGTDILPKDTLPEKHFAERPKGTLSNEHLTERTVCERTFHRKYILPKRHDILLKGQLAERECDACA